MVNTVVAPVERSSPAPLISQQGLIRFLDYVGTVRKNRRMIIIIQLPTHN